MSGSKDYMLTGILASIGTADDFYFILHHFKIRNLRIEMHFTAMLDDRLADVLDDSRQLVGTNVRVRLIADALIGTVLNENIEHLFNIAPLAAAGIKLSIAIGARTAFSKTIIAFGVD